MSKVMFMRVSGKMIKLMVMESIHIATVTDTLETGKRTNNMVKVLKYGQTILSMTDITNSE